MHCKTGHLVYTDGLDTCPCCFQFIQRLYINNGLNGMWACWSQLPSSRQSQHKVTIGKVEWCSYIKTNNNNEATHLKTVSLKDRSKSSVVSPLVPAHTSFELCSDQNYMHVYLYMQVYRCMQRLNVNCPVCAHAAKEGWERIKRRQDIRETEENRALEFQGEVTVMSPLLTYSLMISAVWECWRVDGSLFKRPVWHFVQNTNK